MLTCFAFAGLLPAQTPAATLVGKVQDASRAAIAGATVQVRNIDTDEARTTESKGDGIHRFQPSAGRYEVTIEKQGFRRLRETSLQLQVDQAARLEALLEIGALAESIQVKVEAPLLNTESGSRGDVIITASG